MIIKIDQVMAIEKKNFDWRDFPTSIVSTFPIPELQMKATRLLHKSQIQYNNTAASEDIISTYSHSHSRLKFAK